MEQDFLLGPKPAAQGSLSEARALSKETGSSVRPCGDSGEEEGCWLQHVTDLQFMNKLKSRDGQEGFGLESPGWEGGRVRRWEARTLTPAP